MSKDGPGERRRRAAPGYAEARLGEILDTAYHSFVSIDDAGRITAWNRAAEKVFGWSRAEALGQPISELIIPPRHRQAHRAGLQRVLTTGEARVLDRSLELSALCRDGREIPVEITISETRFRESGRFHAFIQDITDRQEGQKATAALAAIVASSSDAILSYTLDGKITSWNRAAERMYGYSADEIIGSSASVLVPAEMPNEIEEILRLIRSDRPVDHYETKRVRKDGRLLDISLSVSPIHDASGRVTAASAVARDITELKRTAAQAERAKEEFLAAVSHELRTPLTSILGYVDLLAEFEAPALQGRSREWLEIIKRNAERQLKLVDDLLAVSGAEAGTFRAEAEPIDLALIIRRTVETLEPNAAKAGVEVELRAPDSMKTLGDPVRLGQLAENLISNAIKFTPAGGSVEVRLLDRADAIRLEVSDTGIGMSSEERERVFERMFRSPEASRRQIPGTGLGLTIARAIAEAHGGEIDVISKQGEGSTFCVSLPRHAE